MIFVYLSFFSAAASLMKAMQGTFTVCFHRARRSIAEAGATFKKQLLPDENKLNF
jgi:hypothetical protein